MERCHHSWQRKDPSQAYFWPEVNRRPTCLWPGYFLTWPKDIFLIRRGHSWAKFSKFKPKPKMADPTQHDSSYKKLTRPGSEIFDPDPSLIRNSNNQVNWRLRSIPFSDSCYTDMFMDLQINNALTEGAYLDPQPCISDFWVQRPLFSHISSQRA